MVLSVNNASGKPYQCYILVRPALALFNTFHLATSIWAWWQAERKPNFLFSSNAAFIISGAALKNLIPSAPFFALSLTHSLACSGIAIVSCLPGLKAVYANRRGAVILLAVLNLFSSNTQSSPLPAEVL